MQGSDFACLENPCSHTSQKCSPLCCIHSSSKHSLLSRIIIIADQWGTHFMFKCDYRFTKISFQSFLGIEQEENFTHSGCPNLQCQQQCTRVPFSPYLFQNLLINRHPNKYGLVFLVVLISFLLDSDFVHFLTNLLVICMSICLPWQSVYSTRLPIFKIRLYFCCWVIWVLSIFWILAPYQSYALQIISPIGLVAFCFIDGLVVQKLFSLMYSHSFIFAFISLALWSKTPLTPRSIHLEPMFSSMYVTLPSLTCKSLIYFELIYV